VKLSDYVMQRVAAEGVKHVFLVPGGAAMHLNDSLGKMSGLDYVATFHEHAAAVAAECYGKTANNLGVAMVTAGPGSTNAITGVASAWVNSSPLLVLSGQVKRPDLKGSAPLRQKGVQEIDIESIVRPITKYAATVVDPESVRYHLESAIRAAKTGRPGPTWLAFPLDVQGASVDPSRGMNPPAEERRSIEPKDIQAVLEWIASSKRPILLAGSGVGRAGARENLAAFAERTGIPVQTTWEAVDVIGADHPLYAGRPGYVGSRAANFAVQNCDFLLAIGARLDLATTGYAREKFARGAHRVAVDADRAELDKMSSLLDIAVHADAGDFLAVLIDASAGMRFPGSEGWRQRIRDWNSRYPLVTDDFRGHADDTSTYVLCDQLSDSLCPEDVVVQGSSGIQSEIFFMTFRAKAGQRVLADGSYGAMGYGIPAAIGAAVASGRRTILVDGDGSLNPNIQELETIRRLGLPLKILVVSNGGYASIRASQERYFGRKVAADATSGMSFPDIRRICQAYGIPYSAISREAELADRLREALDARGPFLCEVKAPADEDRVPRLSTVQKPDGSMISRPIEDMFPFLDRDEFQSNMIVEPLPE